MNKIKYTILLACASTSVLHAQTYEFGQDNAWNMPGSGQITKVATGETWKWTITGNGGNHEDEAFYGTQTSQTAYHYELKFNHEFSLADFSRLWFFGDIDKGNVFARLSVTGGTASSIDIASVADGTYDALTGEWMRIDDPSSTNDNHKWDATGSTGTFTTLRFDAFGLENGDRVSTFLRVDGFVATPEPSSTALLGLGSLGMLLRRKR